MAIKASSFKVKRKSFTLIEVLLTVVVLGVLFTVAIANYINFQRRAKTSEAKNSLGSIRTCQEIYYLENGSYLACPKHPCVVPQKSAVLWSEAEVPREWIELAFEPNGKIRYAYSVETSNAGQSFIALANGDLDGDGQCSEFSVTEKSGNIIEVLPLE